jgi:periplasmic divalent cation tolerance protein
MDTDIRTVLVTAPDAATAEAMATTLVEERLAACVNLVPGVTSIFRWQGTLSRASEVLMILKSTAVLDHALRARVVELHPYDVPEVLSLSVLEGHAPYLEWIRSEVGTTP